MDGCNIYNTPGTIITTLSPSPLPSSFFLTRKEKLIKTTRVSSTTTTTTTTAMQGETAATTAADSQVVVGGHHKCSKCSWPYANPHPSAKQRRHHKKVCGKVPGYIVVTGEDDDKPLNADDNITTTSTDNNQLNGSDQQQQHLHPDENQNQNQNQIKIMGEEKSNNVKEKGEIGRWYSTKSEEDVFSDAITDFTTDPLSRTNSIIQQPNSPSNDNQSQSPRDSEKVEDQMENGRKEDLASSSDMPSLVDSNADKFGDVNSENTQIGENITEIKQVSETNGDDLGETLSAAIDIPAGKISSEEFEIDSNSEKINGIMEREFLPDTADATTVLVTDDEAKEAVMDSEVPHDKISPRHNDGCIVGEVNEVFVVYPENAPMDVEKLSEVTVEDCKDHQLLKPELGLDLDCSKVIVYNELHHNNNEEAHSSSSKSGASSDFIVGEEQADGVNLQQEEESSKRMVPEVIVEGQADIAVSMDSISKGIESLPDTTNGVLASSQTEKDEIDAPLGVQELHCGQQDQSNNITPEAHLVVAAGAIPSPSDAVNPIMPDDAVCEDEAKVDDPSVSATSLGVATGENFTNPKENSPAVAVCPSESVENLIHEERNLDYSGGNEVIHSCDENSEVRELMIASVNGKVEDTNVENLAGDPSDVHSQSLLVEEDNNILKQQSDSLVVGLPDCSIDTNSQTDSVGANWGSVSDGTALFLKDVSDVQGTNTPVSMEAAQGTDSPKISTDRFEPPSITSLVKSGNEEDLKSASSEIQTLTTQGEKKKEDGSAELSLDSGKTHSTSLRSLLGSIVEKKVKTKQNDDGPSPKTVNSTTTTESTMKTNQQKEWDSPARLPVTMHREKRKMKQWVPFMCCSSDVNLKTQS